MDGGPRSSCTAGVWRATWTWTGSAADTHGTWIDGEGGKKMFHLNEKRISLI